ncbi:hypothetical protein I7I48_06635 [Histoplasma ohiense]|nr:hypothetical protein I7I48_06635 [Histoplasma ohiense (nom. inval.)]
MQNQPRKDPSASVGDFHVIYWTPLSMFTIDDIYNQVACLGGNDGERTILQYWIYHRFQLPYLP